MTRQLSAYLPESPKQSGFSTVYLGALRPAVMMEEWESFYATMLAALYYPWYNALRHYTNQPSSLPAPWLSPRHCDNPQPVRGFSFSSVCSSIELMFDSVGHTSDAHSRGRGRGHVFYAHFSTPSPHFLNLPVNKNRYSYSF